MFIARSIASGRLLKTDHDTDYVPMPELFDDAKKAYNEVYSGYDDFCDQPEQFHGCKHPIDENLFLRLRLQERKKALFEMKKQKREAAQFLHRADHDVESIYWVLVTTLLRAQPQEVSKDVNLEKYFDTWLWFSQHVIRKGDQKDPRSDALNYDIGDWAAALDPKLSSLAFMLSAMGEQIRPEYGLLKPPKVDHLHEAMRRLLLEQIIAMKTKPIRLQRGVLRPVPTPPALPSLKKRTGSYVSGSASGSKKLKASATDDGRRPRMIAQSHTIGE